MLASYLVYRENNKNIMINFFSGVSTMLNINSVSLNSQLESTHSSNDEMLRPQSIIIFSFNIIQLGNAEWLHGHRLRAAAGWLIQVISIPCEIRQAKASEIGPQKCSNHCQWQGQWYNQTFAWARRRGLLFEIAPGKWSHWRATAVATRVVVVVLRGDH